MARHRPWRDPSQDAAITLANTARNYLAGVGSYLKSQQSALHMPRDGPWRDGRWGSGGCGQETGGGNAFDVCRVIGYVDYKRLVAQMVHPGRAYNPRTCGVVISPLSSTHPKEASWISS